MANTCIAGDYNGEITVQVKRKVTSLVIHHNQGFFKGIKKVLINKETVDSYETIGEESNKSMSSGIARGAVGAALLGGIGAIAGASSGKKKAYIPSLLSSRMEPSACASLMMPCIKILL